GGDRLLPRDLPGLPPPRDDDLPARRAGRLAADRERAAVAPSPGLGRRSARRAVTGVGALGGRRAGKPPLLPGPRLFPLAALQPVVARRAHDDSRRERDRAGRGGRRLRATGAADVRDGPPRGGGPRAGVLHSAPRSHHAARRRGPLEAARTADRGRLPLARRRGSARPARPAAPPV